MDSKIEPVAWRWRWIDMPVTDDWCLSSSDPRPNSTPIRMSRFGTVQPLYTDAALAAAEQRGRESERERCARIAEDCDAPYFAPTEEQDRVIADMSERIAAAIRKGE